MIIKVSKFVNNQGKRQLSLVLQDGAKSTFISTVTVTPAQPLLCKLASLMPGDNPDAALLFKKV
jgi:hypothetical protein